MPGDASRENGKKGGRKKGFPALLAEQARIIICQRLQENFTPIVDKAVELAKEGNKDAREWLTDRAFGKATQPIDLTHKIFIDEETKVRAIEAIKELTSGRNSK